MDPASIGIPFLDDLRRKWQDGTLTGAQALNELTLWEDDAAQRTGDELDAAWILRGEIEAATSGSIPASTPAQPPDAQASQPTSTPTPVQPQPSPSQNPDEQTYDRIPRLRELNGQAASARSRRDWGQIAALRAEAEGLIAQQPSANGTPSSMPGDLETIFARAADSQEAERLVGEAQASRRKGDFSEAAYRLAEAARLDPRYTPISSAQQTVSDLQRTMRDLRDNPLNSPEELADARKSVRRLAEEDAAPESEYVIKKLTDVEAEINRRVEAAKQYVDADLAALDEPGSLDDKLQATGRLGTELAKIEALRPDVPYLPEIRSRYIPASRQVERLKQERDSLLPEISSLDPQKGFDVGKLGGVVQRLEALSSAPLAKGDGSIDTAAQNLGHRLNAYLSSRLPTAQTNASALQEYEQVLALAQRGTHPLSQQQISTFKEAVQKARGGSQPPQPVVNPAPGSAPIGSVRPGSNPPGPAPRPGSVPPVPGSGSQYGASAPQQPRGTMPIPNRGTMPVSGPQPMQGSQQYGSMPVPQGGTMPPPNQGYTPQPQSWTPPVTLPPQGVAAPTEVRAASGGVPVWAWLLPLLVVLAVGGYFGFSAYQNGEKEKQAHAQATSTAQAQVIETSVAQTTALAAADETAEAIRNADATATVQAEEAKTHATETAVAEQAAADATATAQANNSANGTGTIDSVTVDYDVTQSGLKGMLIHVKMTATGVKDVPCQATAYFYYSNGDPVKDLDHTGGFNTVDDQAAASAPFKPGFDDTIYDDYEIFMPYTQFEGVPTGKSDVKFQVQSYILSPYKLLASSAYVEFTLTK